MLNMDMKKIQELPTPEDLKKEFPLPYKVQKIKKQRDQEIEDIRGCCISQILIRKRIC